jgi:hypothetical protein
VPLQVVTFAAIVDYLNPFRNKLLFQAVQKGQKSRFSEASHFPAQSWDADFLDSLFLVN